MVGEGRSVKFRLSHWLYHWHMRDSQSNRNGQISIPRGSPTPEWILMKLGIYNYVGVWPHMQIHMALRQRGWSRRTRDLLSPVRLSVCLSSVACNVRAPYSGGSNFRQYFYDIKYLGHPLTSSENFTEVVPGEPPPSGELNTRGVAKYSDFEPMDGYISETVQERR